MSQSIFDNKQFLTELIANHPVYNRHTSDSSQTFLDFLNDCASLKKQTLITVLLPQVFWIKPVIDTIIETIQEKMRLPTNIMKPCTIKKFLSSTVEDEKREEQILIWKFPTDQKNQHDLSNAIHSVLLAKPNTSVCLITNRDLRTLNPYVGIYAPALLDFRELDLTKCLQYFSNFPGHVMNLIKQSAEKFASIPTELFTAILHDHSYERLYPYVTQLNENRKPESPIKKSKAINYNGINNAQLELPFMNNPQHKQSKKNYFSQDSFLRRLI